jgi:Fis family transcriptional regulator
VKRELDNLITQMHSTGIRYEEAVRQFKRQYLLEVLRAHRGNQCKAAEELGMHRNTLSRTMAELELEVSEVRAGLKRPVRSERLIHRRAAPAGTLVPLVTWGEPGESTLRRPEGHLGSEICQQQRKR